MKLKHLLVAGAALAVLAAIVFSFAFTGGPYLVLTNDETGAVLLRHPAHQGLEFSISYTHSVNLSPVKEIYVINGEDIVLTALEFETFGAGMPTQLEPSQTLVHLPGGGMRIEGFDRAVGQLRYMVGHGAEITLILGELHIPLSSLDAPGQTVRFSVCQRSFWHRFF